LTAVELRVEVRPPWPFRLGGASMDGLLRRRGASLQRLMHPGGERVHVAVIQPAPERVIFGARAATEAAAAEGIARMRFAMGVDDDLRPFYDRFHDDPVIGGAVRADPGRRIRRRPFAWEALLGAITEQLIELERATEIQRRLIGLLGPRCAATGLRDLPTPAQVAGMAPARLVSLDLAPQRALTLRRAAREVASGRVDLDGATGASPESRLGEAVARRLRAIPGIGPWTVESLALFGLGRYDVVPAGDLGFIKLIGRMQTGRPRSYAEIEDVRAFFEPYGEWKGLAAEHLLRAAQLGALNRRGPTRPGPAPVPAGTRSSARAPRPAAA
jgi:DNA-3-methyladenine glycosylase II